MIHKYKILNTRERKALFLSLQTSYGCKSPDKVLSMFAILKNNENKIFIIPKEIGKVNINLLKINSLGLYICKTENNGIRLTIEGCQLLNPKKNIINITKNEAKQWINGKDLACSPQKSPNPYFIVMYKQDYLGTGRFSTGTLKNMIKKGRIVRGEFEISNTITPPKN